MAGLKQEMRQKYEPHSSMAFFENSSSFEEGLLEKIMNLAYANLAPYSTRRWDITAVKSPVQLHKLSKAAADKRIADSAISLIVCAHGHLEDKRTGNGCPEASEKSGADSGEGGADSNSVRRDLELLSLSIGYAAKYYCIDYFVLKSFDPCKVTREFPASRLVPLVIICLGCFRDSSSDSTSAPVRNYYSDSVRTL